MQEEVEHKTVNLAVRSSKVTAQMLYKGLKAFIDHQKRKAAMKAAEKDEPIKGEQSVKELVGQGQGVSSMPIGDDGIKDFKKICNKYGVDFAVVKGKRLPRPIRTASLRR